MFQIIVNNQNLNFCRWQYIGNFGIGNSATNTEISCIPKPKPIPKPKLKKKLIFFHRILRSLKAHFVNYFDNILIGTKPSLIGKNISKQQKKSLFFFFEFQLKKKNQNFDSTEKWYYCSNP